MDMGPQCSCEILDFSLFVYTYEWVDIWEVLSTGKQDQKKRLFGFNF